MGCAVTLHQQNGHWSDLGTQYARRTYRALATTLGMQISISRHANAEDHALILLQDTEGRTNLPNALRKRGHKPVRISSTRSPRFRIQASYAWPGLQLGLDHLTTISIAATTSATILATAPAVVLLLILDPLPATTPASVLTLVAVVPATVPPSLTASTPASPLTLAPAAIPTSAVAPIPLTAFPSVPVSATAVVPSTAPVEVRPVAGSGVSAVVGGRIAAVIPVIVWNNGTAAQYGGGNGQDGKASHGLFLLEGNDGKDTRGVRHQL